MSVAGTCLTLGRPPARFPPPPLWGEGGAGVKAREAEDGESTKALRARPYLLR